MRTLRFGVLGLLAVGGCVVGSPPPSAPPPQQMMPPPSSYAHPGYAYYGAGQPPPPPPSIPAAKVNDPINLGHLRQMAAQPSRCNLPREVAPGVFVHLDCFPYKRVAIAQKHATPAKLNLIKLGRVRWTPGAVHGVAPGGATSGGTVGAGEAPQTYPDLVDHRLNGTEGPIKDQGDVGACTAFALSSVIDNALRRANQNITTSPEHVWSHYGYPTMEDAASGNLNKGITTNEALPYSGKEACEIMRDTTDDCGASYGVRPNSASSDPTLQGRLRTAEAANGHRVTKFEELEGPPNIDEIVATLASGADLWVAMNLDSSKWINGRMPNNVIPDWTQPDGGHALAMSGYRKVAGGGYQFLMHNSWGVSWGDGGYAWLNQAMVQKWMHLAYKVTTDAQPVAPGTDVDCPGDQVLDSVTNKCVGICPDQSRPANGQCPNGPAPPPQPLPLPGLSGWPGIPGMPAIPGWTPAPAQPSQPPGPGPAPSGQPAQPPTAPAWPWPVPSTLPPFLQPPPK